MAQAPAMPLWTDALIGDTTHLSTEEFGAYLLLLIATWRNNGVPIRDEGTRLARICRVSETRWQKRLRPILSEFFDLSAGAWRQKRLEKEWQNCAEKRAKNAAAGRASADARSLKNNKTAPTDVGVSLEPNRERNGSILIHIHNQGNPSGSKDPSESETRAIPEPADPPELAASPASDTDLFGAAHPADQKTTKPPHPSDSELTEEFEEAWRVYPRRDDKADARRAWIKARKRADRETIMAGVRRYSAERESEEARYTKHFATWLNRDCWLDEQISLVAPRLQSKAGGAGNGRSFVNDKHERAEARRKAALDSLARTADMVSGMASPRTGAGDEREDSKVIDLLPRGTDAIDGPRDIGGYGNGHRVAWG